MDDVLESIRKACKSTLAESLGIELLDCSQDQVRASMPVDERTKQPAGLLHGGASVALAETLASIGGLMYAQPAGKKIVGQEINANHLRPKKDGIVIGCAKPIHIGQSSHVWEIKITDERERLICISRCTLRVL